MPLFRASFGLILVGCFMAGPVQAQTNGIFADFSTGAGAFTVELAYGAAPRTVAHFIRMAEGGQSWMDPVNGAARTEPWYSGSGWYQVQYAVPSAGVTNVLALQGGLRAVAGSWSGGPGYGILDEVNNGLSHSNGVISMVTDGPHTGAAEFMILLTNGAAYWDGRQTAFGRVSAGMAVVQAIAGGGQAGGTLIAPTVISNVAIRRVGAAAAAFSAERADLPMVQADGCRVDVLPGGTSQYVCVKGPQSETIMAHTSDLLDPQWTLYSFGFNGTTQAVGATVPFSTTLDGWFRHFFHGTRVSYPVFSAIPLDGMARITFAAQWGDGTVYQYWLNLAAKTGMWQNVTTTGAVVRIADSQMISETRRGNCTHLNFMDQNGNIFDYALGFDAKGATTGRYYLLLTSGWTGETLGTEWGDCQYAAWSPGARAKQTPQQTGGRRMPERGAGPVLERGIPSLEP
jgi:cyclophilin family peptidyl-prolyl cis-trans isomerase